MRSRADIGRRLHARLVPAASLLAAVVVLGACSAHYAGYRALPAYEDSAGYKLPASTVDNSDSLFVILAFSGGGTRAAAFSYGVMEAIRKTHLGGDFEGRTLLDEVDVISSVSGGSFTAAYYSLFREDLFTEFEDAFLERNIQGQLVRRFLNPLRWPRLLTPGYDRIHLAADLYHRTVFREQTYDELLDPLRRPLLIVNATDMSTGSRFGFTQYQFDPLCQDLSSVPIADAVAASSAFPFLLTPLTVPSHAGTCDYVTPQWVRSELDNREWNAPMYYRALEFLTYLDLETQRQYPERHEPVEKRYIHLLDGGVADNIGLRGPLEALASPSVSWSVLRKVNNREVDRIVLITVNARPGSIRRWSERPGAPKIGSVFGVVAGAPMRNYSFDTVQLAEKYAQDEVRDQRALQDCKDLLDDLCPEEPFPGGDLHEISVYSIEVNFDAVEDSAERRALMTLGTSFNLPNGAVDRLRRAARTVLEGSTEFQLLLDDLEATLD